MAENNAVVGIYNSRTEAEASIKETPAVETTRAAQIAAHPGVTAT